MARIQVNPDQLDQIASQFDAKRQESEQMIQHLRNQISSLEGEWLGDTKNRFFEQFNQAEQNMRNFTCLLENISTALKQIATKFRQTDQA